MFSDILFWHWLLVLQFSLKSKGAFLKLGGLYGIRILFYLKPNELMIFSFLLSMLLGSYIVVGLKS